MGVSDRHHFAWLIEAIDAFEDRSGRLTSIRERSTPRELWCLAAHQRDPVVDRICHLLGSDDTSVTFFDKFPMQAGVTALDLNALAELPAHGCDVLALFRGSYFISDPSTFLREARRVLRPGGVVLVDWLHGLSNAPVLDLRGDPRYGDGSTPFLTTYVDSRFLSEFPREFGAFIRHVNRPPSWVDTQCPGRRIPWAERLERMLRRSASGLTAANYIETVRAELGRAGKHLIEPPVMERHFTVLFRHARYFYRHVRKFNLCLLTALAPVV